MKAELKHVDYDCGGTVRGGKLGVLSCMRCAMTSAAGPFTVISEPTDAARSVARRRSLRSVRERRWQGR